MKIKAYSMLLCAPFSHSSARFSITAPLANEIANVLVQYRLIRFYHILYPFINRLEIPVGDNNSDLNDDVRLFVQPWLEDG